MALPGWRNILTMSQCYQRALVAFLRKSLAKQKLTANSTLPPLVHGRLFRANHLDGDCFLIRNIATRPVACNSALRKKLKRLTILRVNNTTSIVLTLFRAIRTEVHSALTNDSLGWGLLWVVLSPPVFVYSKSTDSISSFHLCLYL